MTGGVECADDWFAGDVALADGARGAVAVIGKADGDEVIFEEFEIGSGVIARGVRGADGVAHGELGAVDSVDDFQEVLRAGEGAAVFECDADALVAGVVADEFEAVGDALDGALAGLGVEALEAEDADVGGTGV